MRLITHNMLKSNMKGVVSGFPLKIEGDKVDVRESEFSAGKWYKTALAKAPFVCEWVPACVRGSV